MRCKDSGPPAIVGVAMIALGLTIMALAMSSCVRESRTERDFWQAVAYCQKPGACHGRV